MIIKNSNIRRSIVENRYVIFVVIFAIILVLSLLQTIKKQEQTNLVKENQNKQIQSNQVQNNQIQNTTTVPNVNTSNKPSVLGKDVIVQKQEENTKIIEEFITYCNNHEIEKAYELLTKECKEEIFSSNMEYFKKNYVEKIFTSKKMCSIQAWVNSFYTTYKVKIQNDILASGTVNSIDHVIEDYYTVIEERNKRKLNINSYIRREEIEKQAGQNGITITVNCKDIYKEYETYDVVVENATQKTILLDSKETVNAIYLIGSNESHYDAYTYEMDIHDNVIESGKKKTYTIRFNKNYANSTVMKHMVFSDIIVDYEEYENTNNKKEYTNRMRIRVEV